MKISQTKQAKRLKAHFKDAYTYMSFTTHQGDRITNLIKKQITVLVVIHYRLYSRSSNDDYSNLFYKPNLSWNIITCFWLRSLAHYLITYSPCITISTAWLKVLLSCQVLLALRLPVSLDFLTTLCLTILATSSRKSLTSTRDSILETQSSCMDAQIEANDALNSCSNNSDGNKEVASVAVTIRRILGYECRPTEASSNMRELSANSSPIRKPQYEQMLWYVSCF